MRLRKNRKQQGEEAVFVCSVFLGAVAATAGTLIPILSYSATASHSSLVAAVEGKYEVSVADIGWGGSDGAVTVRTEKTDSLYKFDYMVENHEVELINRPNSSVTVEQLLR